VSADQARGATRCSTIEVGQLDIFRDEDIRCALTLSQCGVPVELHLHPGVPHEYDAIAFNAAVSRQRAERP
jgi:acetyl esterase/lipase